MARRTDRALRLFLAVLLALGALAALPPAPAAAAMSCEVRSAADSGLETLRAHLDNANCDAITFSLPGGGPWTINLLSQLPAINRTLTITGPGRDLLTLDGGDAVRPLAIVGGTVTITDLTVARGRVTEQDGGGAYGGCIAIVTGQVTLRDLRVRDCVAQNQGGGGLLIAGGTILLERAEVRGNRADLEALSGGGGGGLFVNQFNGDTSVTIRDSVIAGNQATGAGNIGGGLRLRRILDSPNPGNPYTLTVVIERSTIGGPTAADANRGGFSSGGIANAGGMLTLTDSTLSGNTSGGTGGGLGNDGTATLTNVTVSRNVAAAPGGGGIYNGGTLTLTGSTVSGNMADGSGGGIFNAGQLTLTSTTLSGNEASNDGGGLDNVGGTATLTNATLSGNKASNDGGGLFNNANGTTTLRFVTVTGNVADSDGNGIGGGGGLLNISGTVNVLSSIVAGSRRGAATPDDCDGTLASQGRNLWGTQAPCPDNAPLGDRNLVALNTNISQVLAPLAANGGPTQTHALLPGSPAIDRGDNATCPIPIGTDQRGVARSDGQCDVGAYEYTALLTVTTAGTGSVVRSPAGSGGGPFGYAPGTPVELTPQPGPGWAFVGWVMDGVYKGWASPLSLTMDADHTVRATFAPLASFPDVGGGHPDHAAIVALASRGTIRGYLDGRYGPDDGVQRAQMAALIARATDTGPHTPPTMLTPPACLVAGTWDCEDWGNNFTDQSGDPNLWRNAGTLQHYGVALGYTAQDCANQGRAFPCYGPTDPVTYAQTVTFITRMMKVKGYWLAQPGAPLPYANVPGPHQEDVRTFAFYTQGLGGVPAPPSNWNAGATRGWFARALWAALDSYWGTDELLPDGRSAGGLVP